MDIYNWTFKSDEVRKVIQIIDNRGYKHQSCIVNENFILIEKNGTSRILNYPKFVIEYILDETKKITNNDTLILLNKEKRQSYKDKS